ncbi:mitochondrial ribosomal protein subunit S8 [Daedalea quercina L-15889]|uniref:Mitochondrial ribosomal protein subunit S8 n=1 Tax=Daedalea quercina L-15889 TaxID=1314783 RepID=A0A165Q2K0_9APHY|nr:mitochondrial ribosomal protein subunit S8 [Daedalea quercina L-15889]
MLPHVLCSSMQNAFRARHARIAVDHTRQNLGILSILLRAGMISSLTRGDVSVPSPDAWSTAGDAQKRIWVDLKYRESFPALTNMELISKPSKHVMMDASEIRRICTGRRAQNVKPLRMGEVAVIRTRNPEHEWLEAREAMQLQLGGEVICRAR